MTDPWPEFVSRRLKGLAWLIQDYRRQRFQWADTSALDTPRSLPYTECKLLRPELEDMLKQVNEEIERHETGLVR